MSTYSIEFQDRHRQDGYRIRPGQFNMIYLPGAGEVPISVSGTPEEGPGIGHTIRFVGASDPDDRQAGARQRRSACRGPYGRGWPIEHARGRDVLFVAGGLGLAPLRPAIKVLLADRDRYGRITLLYGARHPTELLYTAEYPEWERRGMEILVTVDHADESWHGRVGVVPVLFNRLRIDPKRTIVLTCGPEVLMRHTVDEALNHQVDDRDIYYSMERNMHCAIGMCGHCQLGPAFICKDGPVFAHSELAPFFRLEHY